MCPRFFICFPLCSLEEVCGNALLGILEVLDCVEFAGEEFCDVEHREGASLGDETQEGQLVERPCVMAREQLPKSGYGTSMFGKSRSMPRSRPSLSSLITVMPGKASALRGACPASLFM